uniref:IRS-type PTB domain-containing protein n=1 Tax=Melopsittacus undulatus TaxID=13146 RepID=A0A8V5HA21_MELUD
MGCGAGRRCASGEGNFEFETRQGNEIFQAIELAISEHQSRDAEEPWKEDDAPRSHGHARMPSWAQGHEDSMAHHPEDAPDPLYDSISMAGGQAGKQPPLHPSAPKPEHIYDEPEGLSSHTVYHEPEEVKGEAWRLQAAPEEPTGHEYPYSPQRDDYAVPKRAVPLRQPFLLQGKEYEPGPCTSLGCTSRTARCSRWPDTA